jgi:hypothetical protein
MPIDATDKVASSAIVAVVVMLVVGSAIYSQSIAQPARPACVTDEDRVQIRRQVLSAVDDALHDHMKALFLGWIKDPRDQPNRASAGLQAAIVAYQRARADALKWSPSSC